MCKLQAGVRCQHGPAECRLDRIINCAIALSPSGQPQWLPFLRCLESSSPDTREEAVKGCLEEAGLEPEAVGTCATGGRCRGVGCVCVGGCVGCVWGGERLVQVDGRTGGSAQGVCCSKPARGYPAPA